MSDTLGGLDQTDFDLFGLPVRFAIDRATLDQRRQQLLKLAHPDKFVAQGSAAQRLAMQWSVRINEGYARLKDPISRAAYLCQLNGLEVNAQGSGQLPAALLVQQMDWREAMEEADTELAIEALLDEASAAKQAALATLERLCDQAHDWVGASQQVRALMFVHKFALEVQAKMDRLADA